MWKSGLKMSRDKWLILLVCGVLLLILSFPRTGGGLTGNQPAVSDSAKNAGNVRPYDPLKGQDTALTGTFSGSGGGEDKKMYTEELEKRVKEILKNVEGVGEVDVMITLRSSGEKVLHVDKDKSRSSTEETDSAGGARKSMSEDVKETALLSGSSTGGEPVVEKELLPEIEGIIISAQGGGSATVKAEISEAMQALFNIPAHKIKVLKRVE